MSSKSPFNPFRPSAHSVNLHLSKPSAPEKDAKPKPEESENLSPATANTQQPHHTALEPSQASAVNTSKTSLAQNAPRAAVPKTDSKDIPITVTPKPGSVGNVSGEEVKREYTWNRELTEREQHAVALGKAFFKNAMT